MRYVYIILMLILSVAAKAQVIGLPISQLPTAVGTPPPTAWIPISVGTLTQKTSLGTLTGAKMDSVFVRNDSLIGVKNSVQYFGGKLATDRIPRTQFYTGSTNVFTVPWLPLAGSISIYIRSLFVPADCYSISGNQITINTTLLGYQLQAGDRITINFQSLQ